MPQLIAPLIAPVLGVAATSTTAVVAANAIAFVGVNAASMLIQMAMAPTQKEPGTKLRASSGGAVSQSIVFGEKETAGSLIYAGTWGKPDRTPNGFYARVFCLQDMPSTAILERCWTSDNKGTLDLDHINYTDDASTDYPADGSGYSGSGEVLGHPITTLDHDGFHYGWVKFLDGTQTAADPYLRAMFGDLEDRPWKASMIGRGRTLMIVTQQFTHLEGNAEKNVVAVIRGMALYDWRKDSTNGGSGSHRWGDASTYEYTGNPIVIAYNIMRGIYRGNTWLYGGQNWPARRFDNDSWTAAANTCDENVTLAGGGTQKRYRMGAEVALSEEPLAVLDRIFATCGGRLVESGGIYKIHVGGLGASVYSFTDDDIIISENLTGKNFPTREEICNTIAGSYCEPDNGGQMKAYKKRFKQAYIDADRGETRSKEMTFDYVRSNTQAQRLALHALNDNRRFGTKVVAFPTPARKLEPGDTINWSASARFGYSNKKWIVGDVTLAGTGIVFVSIREADSTDSDWSVGDEDAYTVGVYGDVVPNLQTLHITATAHGVRNNAGTYKKPGIKINWDETDPAMVDCKAVRWQIRLLDIDEIMDAGRVEWDEGQVILKDGILRNEAYQVRAKIIPYSNRRTAWSDWEDVVADDYGAIGDDDFDNTPPPDIPNNPIWLPSVSNKPQISSDADRDEDGKVVITVTTDWVELANDKIDYQIRLAYGSKVRWINARSSPKEFVGRSGVAYTIRVRPVGRTGVKGNLSDSITFTASKKSTVPDAPTSLTASGRFGRIVLRWSKPTESDFRRANIYVSDDNNFANATLLDHFTASKGEHGDLGNAVTKYYWITFENWSGVESLKFPVSDTGGRTATTVPVADSDTDPTAPNAPTVSALSSLPGDIDGDGTPDTGFQFTVTAPGSGPAPKFYEVECQRANAQGSSGSMTGYSKIWARSFPVDDPATSADTLIQIESVTNKWFKVRVRGKAFNGKPGAWSSFQLLGYQPSGYSNTMPTVAWQGSNPIVAKPKAIWLRFVQITLATYPQAKEIVVYRNTANDSSTAVEVGTAPPGAQRYIDNDDLVAGTTYYYWLKARDRKNQLSASFSAVQSVAWKLVGAADLAATDLQNLAPNGDFSQGLDGWKRPIGTVTWINGVGSGPSQYAVKLDRVTTENSITTFDNFNGTTNDVGVACNSGDKYVIDCWVFSTVAGNVQHDVVTRTSAGSLAGWNFAAVAVSAGVWTNVIAEATVGASGKAFLRLQNVINNSTLFVTNVRWLRKNGADLVVDGTIVEKLTDQTAPNAPTVGALSSITGDIDLDGSPDTGFQFTVTAPGSGPAPKFYEVEVQRAAAQGSSGSMTGYAKIWSRPFPTEDPGISADTLIQVQSVTNKWFKARVRCVSFSGKKGAWSSFQNLGFQPSGYSNTMPTVAWQGSNPIVAKPKAIWLRFVQITLATYPQAKEIVVYRNTSNNSATATEIGTAPPGAQRYQDNDDLTPGTTYYYWLKVRDRQNAVSASFSTVQSVAWRAASAVASDGDFDTTALAAPGSLANPQDNKDVNGDKTIDLAYTASWNAVSNATSYELEVSRSTTLGGTYTVIGVGGITNNLSWSFPVNVNYFYRTRVRARNAYGQPGTWSGYTTGTQPTGKTTSTAPTTLTVTCVNGTLRVDNTETLPADYAYTELWCSRGIVGNNVALAFLVTSFIGKFTFYQIPWDQLNQGWQYYWIRYVTQSEVASSYYPAATSGVSATPTFPEGSNLADSSIFYNNISVSVWTGIGFGDVGTWAFCKNTSGSTISGNGTVAGSNLQYTDTALTVLNSPSGTWRCFGRCANNAATLFLRIS